MIQKNSFAGYDYSDKMYGVIRANSFDRLYMENIVETAPKYRCFGWKRENTFICIAKYICVYIEMIELTATQYKKYTLLLMGYTVIHIVMLRLCTYWSATIPRQPLRHPYRMNLQ